MKDIHTTQTNLNKLIIQSIKSIEKTYKLSNVVERLFMEFNLDALKLLDLMKIKYETIGKHVIIYNFEYNYFNSEILRIYGMYQPFSVRKKTKSRHNYRKSDTYKQHRE